jgi:hypothetical protein
MAQIGGDKHRRDRIVWEIFVIRFDSLICSFKYTTSVRIGSHLGLRQVVDIYTRNNAEQGYRLPFLYIFNNICGHYLVLCDKSATNIQVKMETCTMATEH